MGDNLVACEDQEKLSHYNISANASKRIRLSKGDNWIVLGQYPVDK